MLAQQTGSRLKGHMGHLILFAGRAGDRNDRGMSGAERMGRAFSEVLGVEPLRVGAPAPPIAAGWEAELDAARPELLALRGAVSRGLAERPTITILNRCAASLGTLPAVAEARPDACIVWFDAHGDANSPEHSVSGYLGGMVLTGAAGRWSTGLGAGLDLANVVLVGSRDLDACERQLIDEGTLALVEAGRDLCARLRDAVAGRPVYIHLDCDVLEPGLVPTEFAVPGGLSSEDLHCAFAVLAEGEVIGLEVAEFEATWPDGSPGDPEPLIAAMRPILDLLRA